MTFSFRPAVREGVALIIGLAGSSGSGKTSTAMRLASGISGGKSGSMNEVFSDKKSYLSYIIR